MTGQRLEPTSAIPLDPPGRSAVARRVVSISAVFFAWCVVHVLLPVALLVAVVADAASRRAGWLFTRFTVHLVWLLWCEVYGILASFLFWCAGFLPGVTDKVYRDWHLRLQLSWAAAHWKGIEWIHGTRIMLEAPEEMGSGPMILFIRHASLADTILPCIVIQRPAGLRLRYVMKRELLWEPCLDIVGHRLPNCFVDRYSDDSREEIRRVTRMLDALEPNEGVLIYPEGTRPTPARRARARERLLEKEPDLARRTEGLRNILPPRPGGPLALLEKNSGLDVVFCAHEGLDDVAGIPDIVSGALWKRVVRIRAWRVPFEELPVGKAERLDWLLENWQRVDDWVGETRERRLKGIALP